MNDAMNHAMNHAMPSVLILGSGQLGLMLAEVGARLGITVDRLDVDTHELVPGTSTHRIPVSDITALPEYTAITAERECLPDTALTRALRMQPAWRHAQAFNTLPHRAEQKHLLDQLQIPTAPWCVLKTPEDLTAAQQRLGKRLVLKITEGGYDGRGQWRLDEHTPASDIQALPQDIWGNVLAESCLAFREEVSLIGVRERSGRCAFLPLTTNVHHAGILRYSHVPGTQTPERHAQQTQAETLLTRLMNALEHVGVMAMECFVMDNGLVVNEIAPRVHNSGHWSQDGASVDQFTWHLHAVCGLPLQAPVRVRPTWMLNLIGCDWNPAWLTIPGMTCHWYGKTVRPGRKLGHLNLDASNPFALRQQVAQLHPLLDQDHQYFLMALLDSAASGHP